MAISTGEKTYPFMSTRIAENHNVKVPIIPINDHPDQILSPLDQRSLFTSLAHIKPESKIGTDSKTGEPVQFEPSWLQPDDDHHGSRYMNYIAMQNAYKAQVLQNILEKNLGNSYKTDYACSQIRDNFRLVFSFTGEGNSPSIEDFVQQAFQVKPENIKSYKKSSLKYFRIPKICELDSDKGLEVGVLSNDPNQRHISLIDLLNSRPKELQPKDANECSLLEWDKIFISINPKNSKQFILDIDTTRTDLDSELRSQTPVFFLNDGLMPQMPRMVLA